MSFLQDYLEYTSGTETSRDYHVWCAISALSSIISRKVWIYQGRIRHYPNLYIVLVGDPGSGKSFAMDHARKLVVEMGIPCAPSVITLEALTELLGERNEKSPHHLICRHKDLALPYTHLSIFATELVNYLGAEPFKHINFLISAWDEDVFHVKTKNKGEDYIKFPFVTLLGCLTPEISNSLFKQQIINGGLSRRCLFIFSPKRGNAVAFPEMLPHQVAALKRLKAQALEMRSIVGEFEWAPEAREWFTSWYNTKHLKMSEANELAMQGYLRSKDGILLKIAMLLSISEDRTLTMETKNLEKALTILEATEQFLPKILQGGGRNPMAHVATLMREDLEREGKILPLKSFIARYFQHGDHRELNEVVDHLINEGSAVRLTNSQGFFLATPAVASQSQLPSTQ